MKTLIQQFNDLENQLGLSDDAVIHKAMQESLEFVEAVDGHYSADVVSEAKDAIANILSAHYRLTGQSISKVVQNQQSSLMQFTIGIGKRNDTVQKYRGIYARNQTSQESLTDATKTSVAQILGLTKVNTNISLDVEQALQELIVKLQRRLGDYPGHINIQDYIHDVPNFPKPGIIFKDINPLLQSPEALHHTVHQLSVKAKDADIIVGLDARGFIFGAAVAHYLSKPFVMIRKKGKLPGQTIEESYDLEYGNNTQAIQANAIQRGHKVALIDDVLATGGTAAAACNLVEKLGGIVQGCHFVIELDGLNGRQLLKNKQVSKLISY